MKTKKLIYGVATNDADYVVTKCETIIVNGKKKLKVVWRCPYYVTWTNMLRRSYSVKDQECHPTYKGCSVSDEWLTFSNFKAWMMNQDWEGNQLDKDLLVKDNKVYGADNCAFVSQMVNLFVTDSRASRGEYLIGVCWNKRDKKFQARCNNPFTKKRENLGLFTSEQEAHEAWKKRKLELAKELAEIQKDPRVAKALIERYL